MSASASPLSGTIADRYVVERELGRGATSNVFLARDLDLGRMVALKVLRLELAESTAAERFLREIKLTEQLQHPNILPVLGSGVHEGRPYFVLPYMDGGTLRERIAREKQLPLDEVIQIGLTIASALHSAHERNLLHRDVKPENILFTNGQACLSDFGIARAITRAIGDSTTTTGLVRGTPAYMSPEQASGASDYDGRSDLYSLACVLYEAAAGVAAFVGATPQAVVAQRITHEPRPIRVYRPSASPGLEAVLAKALSTAPADRYQNAGAFAAALKGSESARALTPRGATRRRWTMIGLAGLAVFAIVLSAVNRIQERSALDALDTTRVAVLPFGGSAIGGVRGENLLSDALRQWHGVSLLENFTVSDAVRRFAGPLSNDEARNVARSLRAGRFVRGRVQSEGEGIRIEATLFDARNGSALHTASRTVAPDSGAVLAGFEQLADALMLRAAADSARNYVSRGPKNLPATQAFIRASAALGEWDLVVAESLYAQAVQFDPTNARATFWLAQVRVWGTSSSETWRELASRAALDTGMLAREERPLAIALAALSGRDYGRACESYRTVTRSNPSSFAAWYGLAECLRADQTVVADKLSPTGWSFRASYHQAIQAYLRAFDLVPSVYRSYQGGAYSRLARLLYVTNRLRRIGATDGPKPIRFASAPLLQSDTLAFIPSPLTEVASVTSVEDPAATARAVEHNRAVFHRVTRSWATVFPRSPAAKEGLAISLELGGDPAAIDTIKSALRLATDPDQRLHLAASLAWVQLKFGIAGDAKLLQAARRTVDSVLRANPPPYGRHAETIGRLGAVGGRCGIVRAAVLQSAEPIRLATKIETPLAAEAQARLAQAALGCATSNSQPGLAQLVDAARLNALPQAVQPFALTEFIGREIRSAAHFDSTWGRRIEPAGDYLIAARLAVARGHPDSARRIMTRILEWRRGVIAGGITPDAVVPETYVWLALGDSAMARQRLDALFADASHLPPMFLSEVDNLVLVASTIRAMVLRAELANRVEDRTHWAQSVLALWDGSDESMRVTLERMRSLIGR